MRKLSEAVVSTYVQIVLTVTIGVLMYIQGANFNFLAEFSLVQWILLIAASIVQIFKSMTKFLACRYHTASDLQKLAFLPNVWTFLIDVLILKATFSGLEPSRIYTAFCILRRLFNTLRLQKPEI
jgi:hypothetical protein